MKNILISLDVIQRMSKQLHYSLSGESFYALHLLMDVVGKDLSDFRDKIKEVYYLSEDLHVPYEKDLLRDALDVFPDDVSLHTLCIEVKKGIYTIESALKPELTSGEIDLLGKISKNLSKSLGLLNRVLAKYDK